jgi:hypothetical protein
MWRKCPVMCHPLWSNGRPVSQSVSSFMVKWETSVLKCVILYDQMGEQHSIMYNPLESDGRTVPQSVSSFMVKWDTTVLKCVILYDQVGEQHSIIYEGYPESNLRFGVARRGVGRG